MTKERGYREIPDIHDSRTLAAFQRAAEVLMIAPPGFPPTREQMTAVRNWIVAQYEGNTESRIPQSFPAIARALDHVVGHLWVATQIPPDRRRDKSAATRLHLAQNVWGLPEARARRTARIHTPEHDLARSTRAKKMVACGKLFPPEARNRAIATRRRKAQARRRAAFGPDNEKLRTFIKEGCSISEIARKTGLSYPTVRNAIKSEFPETFPRSRGRRAVSREFQK